MKLKQVAAYLLVFSLAVPGLAPVYPDAIASFLMPKAEARIFRRFFGRRPRSFFRGARSPVRFVQSSSGRVVSQPRAVRNNLVVQNSGNRGNGQIQQVDGFAALAKQGNALLERDQANPFLFRRLFIDPRTGALLGATRGETVRQLRQFYLTNFDKFNGNAKRLVQQFLVRNGAAAAITGQVRVDLTSGVTPKYSNMTGRDRDVQLAGLNYLLNTISQTSRLLRVGRNNVNGDGTVSLNLNGAVRSAALALLTNDNPYACGRNVPPRLDFLVERAMDPQIYRQLLGLTTLQDLARDIGVQDDKRRTAGNKITVAAPPGKPKESIPGIAPERVLEVQSQRNVPGGDFFISWDVFGNRQPGGVETESRNPFISGINFTNDATEFIWHKSNGFLAFGLANSAGVMQDEAPANVAEAVGFQKDHLGTGVKSPMMCLTCHASGFWGGGRQGFGKGEPYTENLNRIPSFHRQFFTTNAAYNARARRATAVFMNSMKRAGAFIPVANDPSRSVELLPDFINEYRKPIDFTQAAKELGTSKEVVASIFGRADGKFQRSDFERNYCRILSRVQQLGGNSVLAGGVNRGLPINSLTGGRTHQVTSPGGRRFAR